MSIKSKGEKVRQSPRSDSRPSAIRTQRSKTLYFSWLRPNFFLLFDEIVNTEKIVEDEKGIQIERIKSSFAPFINSPEGD
jgi:hypothetical protein